MNHSLTCCSFRRVKLKILPSTKKQIQQLEKIIHYASNSLDRGISDIFNKHWIRHICVCFASRTCPLTIKPWLSPRCETSQHLAKPRRDRSQIRRNIFEIRRLYDFWVEGRGAIGKPPWFPKDPTHQNPKNLKLHKIAIYFTNLKKPDWSIRSGKFPLVNTRKHVLDTFLDGFRRADSDSMRFTKTN